LAAVGSFPYTVGMNNGDDLFVVQAPGVDVAGLLRDIEATVARKRADGVYDHAAADQADPARLAQLKNHDEFLAFYLKCLREASFVDISDFEIRERRRGLAPLLVRLKRGIWSLLKFYTYRLWSQQNQVNGLLVTAVENLDLKYEQKVAELEKRIAELEQQATPSAPSSPRQ
jgi:hypothetical protein